MTDLNEKRALNFVQILRRRAQAHPDRLAFTFLADRGEPIERHYGELHGQACLHASRLLELTPPSLSSPKRTSLPPRALLLSPPSLDYIEAFFGCLFAGVIPVPAYPPRKNRSLARLASIVEDSGATIAIGPRSVKKDIDGGSSELAAFSKLKWLHADEASHEPSESMLAEGPVGSRPTSDLAFLQYTSGSTATPRGVKITHTNLTRNSASIERHFGHDETKVGVIWLPPYHDMGLIGGILQTIYSGFRTVLMTPTSFLMRPYRWLQTISEYRGTTSGAPNFAFDLAVDKTTPEQRATLDLSSWEVAFTGAEPVRKETLERFADTFAPCGFRREAFFPCYGLAEATLMVTGGVKSEPPITVALDATALEKNVARPPRNGDDSTVHLVGNGLPIEDHRVCIVDPKTSKVVEEGQIGEIWVRGPCVAPGYWNRESEGDTFLGRLSQPHEGRSERHPYLRTGDLGFLHGDELFVTGRLKDLIVIQGRNFYPHDIEHSASGSHPSLRPGGGAAFAMQLDGRERLMLAHEVERSHLRSLVPSEVIDAIRRRVMRDHEVAVYGITLLRPGRLPKTSSGKIRRHACREASLWSEQSSVLARTPTSEFNASRSEKSEA